MVGGVSSHAAPARGKPSGHRRGSVRRVSSASATLHSADVGVEPASLVPGIGLEPISLSARASKTLVSANFTTRAGLDCRMQIADFRSPNKRQIPSVAGSGSICLAIARSAAADLGRRGRRHSSRSSWIASSFAKPTEDRSSSRHGETPRNDKRTHHPVAGTPSCWRTQNQGSVFRDRRRRRARSRLSQTIPAPPPAGHPFSRRFRGARGFAPRDLRRTGCVGGRTT